jgi:hypothetical protein
MFAVYHNMSWVLKVERQAYNNEEMWKKLGIPNLRMQKVMAHFRFWVKKKTL